MSIFLKAYCNIITKTDSLPFDLSQDLNSLNLNHTFENGAYIIPLVEGTVYEPSLLSLIKKVKTKSMELKKKLDLVLEIYVPKTEPLTKIKGKISENDTYFIISLTRTGILNDIILNLLLYLEEEAKGGKTERSELLFEHEGKIFETTDIVETLYSKKHIHRDQIVAGTNILGPELTKLYNALVETYKENILEGFNEIILPKFETFDTWAKSGHIRLAEFVQLVTRFKTQKAIKYKIMGSLFKRWEIETEDLQIPSFGVSYGQCPAFWPSLQNVKLREKDLPLKYFDNSGFSGRFEGNAIKSLDRLNFFSRIELVFVDNLENLPLLVKDILSRYCKLLENLELKYRILKVQSWIQTIHSKPTETYDLEAYIPWANKWLEIANVSNNCKSFTNAFDVKSDIKIGSGCSGLGKDRLTYAFLSQKGLDPVNWPKCIQNKVDINLFKSLY